MSEHRVYHVIRRSGDSWQVIREGFQRPHVVRDSKAEAIFLAKRLARSGAGALVVVHSTDNYVEREFRFAPTRTSS